jgi:hypothetical protein
VANIGSLSYGYYKLNQSRIKMCALGDGQFFRNEPSYSLQTIDGKNNKAECLSTQSALFANNIWLKNLWGVVGLSDVELVPNLSLTPPEWPSFPREEAVKRQTVDLQAKIEEAQKKPAREEINDLVDVAAAFSLDKTSPRQALEKIMSLENSQANILVDAIDPGEVLSKLKAAATSTKSFISSLAGFFCASSILA